MMVLPPKFSLSYDVIIPNHKPKKNVSYKRKIFGVSNSKPSPLQFPIAQFQLKPSFLKKKTIRLQIPILRETILVSKLAFKQQKVLQKETTSIVQGPCQQMRTVWIFIQKNQNPTTEKSKGFGNEEIKLLFS